MQILVNNAGSESRERFAPPLELRDVALDKTLSSVCRMREAALPRLRAEKASAILNLRSSIGMRTWGIEPWYAPAKAAIAGLTRAQAGMHGRPGVRVNAVCPGLIRTRRTTTLSDDPVKAANSLAHKSVDCFDARGRRRAHRVRGAQPRAFITGETITIDGGWSLN